MDAQTAGWTVGRTEGQTEGRTIGRTDVGRSDDRTDGQADGRMVGWTDGQLVGRTDDRMDGRTDSWTEGQTDGQSDGRTAGQRHGRTDGRTDGQTDGTTGFGGWGSASTAATATYDHRGPALVPSLPAARSSIYLFVGLLTPMSVTPDPDLEAISNIGPLLGRALLLSIRSTPCAASQSSSQLLFQASHGNRNSKDGQSIDPCEGFRRTGYVTPGCEVGSGGSGQTRLGHERSPSTRADFGHFHPPALPTLPSRICFHYPFGARPDFSNSHSEEQNPTAGWKQTQRHIETHLRRPKMKNMFFKHDCIIIEKQVGIPRTLPIRSSLFVVFRWTHISRGSICNCFLQRGLA